MPDAVPWQFTPEQLRALSSVTLLWATSATGDVVEPNPSWEAYTGQPWPDYRGAGWLDAVHPDDRDAARQRWQASVAGQRRLEMTYRLRRHDGAFRAMRSEGVPVQAQGATTGWVGSCHDVTDLQTAQLALVRSEERYRFLDALGQATRTLADPVDVMSTTARLLAAHLGATRCAYADLEADEDTFTIRADWSAPGVPSSAGVYSLTLFGPQAVHNLKRGVFLVVQDVDRELGDEGGGRMFRAIGIHAIVCAPLVKAGRLVAMMAVHQAEPRAWTESEVALIGEVVERCWAHIERVRAAALVREQDRRKDEFLATLAHELRNPLAPMRFSIAILDRVAPGSAQAVNAQATIERQIDMMARLIEDLMDLSRVNRGLIELRQQAVDLADVLDHAVDAARPSLSAARHSLDVTRPAAPLTVDGDPARLVQVVTNLLNNAAKYTPDGGHLRVAAWQEGTRAVIEVTDNGIGIPLADQSRLFQMFTQLPHTARRSQGGLGIGLALVKRLVEMHGGSVRARSAGLDEGSTFTVELPATGVTPPHEAPSAGAAPRTPGAIKVLVVEDNPDGLAALITLLGLWGHDARGAADGEAGHAEALAFTPDVVLLDLGLPRKDGLTLARELRSEPSLAGVKLVALTGWGTATHRQDTRDAGFDLHLTKPIDLDQLQRLLTDR